MTSEETGVELLSREEMEALLEGISGDPGKGGDRSEPLLRDRRSVRRPALRYPRLRQAVEAFAATWSRLLSSTHQRRIECRLADWHEGSESVEEFLLPTDRPSLFEVLPVGAQGFVLPSRTLVFALLSLEFGARAADARIVPARPYTAIERRFLGILSREILETLAAQWSEWAPVESRLIGCVEPTELSGSLAERLAVASLEIRGLGLVAGLRVGIPASSFRADQPPADSAVVRGAPEVAERVKDLSVTLHARVGTARMTVSRLGSLRTGDVLTLEPASSNGLLVEIEGRPKFRALRGSVGRRLAVQIEERL